LPEAWQAFSLKGWGILSVSAALLCCPQDCQSLVEQDGPFLRAACSR